MKRNYWTHVTWLAITLGFFVAGYRSAHPPLRDSAPKSAFLGTPPAPGKPPVPASSEAEQPTKLHRPMHVEAKLNRSDQSDSGNGGLASIPAASTGTPLLNHQLQSLARTATRSLNLIERHRAFNRLLQEVQSGTFTAAQAMTIRSAMAQSGASDGQWRLFDYAWGASDPAAALAYLDEIPAQEFNKFLGNMIPGLASVDPQAAIDLFHGLEGNVQSAIRNRFYEGLIDHDVTVATNYMYDASASSQGHDWRPMDIMTREVVKEAGLNTTLQWAADLPEGRLRANAWSAAYAVWGTQKPEAALQEITRMPPSSDRNQAINGFISGLAGQDGATAVTWAAEITQPGMREAAMVRAGKQFYRQDQQGATEWFQTTGLSVEAWEQLTSSR